MQLFRSKFIIPATLLAITLLNIALYKFHAPTNQTIDELWLQYTYKSVDQFRISKVYQPDDLRVKLAREFPYEKSNEPIPRRIWQMWKTKDVTTLDFGLQRLIATWSSQDDFYHKIIPNDEFVEFVSDIYKDRVPEVVEAFRRMPLIILQSDLIRYLILLAHGGVYSDIDTSLRSDLNDWLSYNNTLIEDPANNKIGLTIGVESDRDDKGWVVMPRRLQFCQWTLQAKSGHPFYRELVHRIVDLSLHHYDPKTKILTKHGKKYDFNDGSSSKYEGVMEWTGPGMFTDTVFDYLNEVYKVTERLVPGQKFREHNMINKNSLRIQKKIKYAKPRDNGRMSSYDPVERPIGWQNLTLIEEPILFDEDVLLLPPAYLADKKSDPRQYVFHHFKGSWKN